MSTTAPASTYRARVGSVPYRVIEFLKANHPEELTRQDIADKFDLAFNSVQATMESAIKGGAVVLERNKDLEYVYRLPTTAEAKKQIQESATPPTAASFWPSVPTASTPSSSPKRAKATLAQVIVDPLDIESLQVERGVPLLGRGGPTPGQSKWKPLFDKLKNPGLSIEIPAEWKAGLAAAATKRNAEAKKAQRAEQYRVRHTEAGKARIWRVA